LEGERAGGVVVGFEGGMKGVAGERCVTGTWVLERRERKEEKDPLSDGRSASEIVGRLCGSRDDCSVASSSTTASSSTASGTFLTTAASEKVKPR